MASFCFISIMLCLSFSTCSSLSIHLNSIPVDLTSHHSLPSLFSPFSPSPSCPPSFISPSTLSSLLLLPSWHRAMLQAGLLGVRWEDLGAGASGAWTWEEQRKEPRAKEGDRGGGARLGRPSAAAQTPPGRRWPSPQST